MTSARIIKEKIVTFCETHGRLPSQVAGDPEERHLAVRIYYYNRPSGRYYDPKIKRLWDDYPTSRSVTTNDNYEEIRRFCKDQGHIPRWSSKDPEEAVLGRRWNNLIIRLDTVHTTIFTEEIRSMYPSFTEFHLLQNQMAIRVFCETHGHVPRQTRTTIEEMRLGECWNRYKLRRVDPAFIKEIADGWPTWSTWNGWNWEEKRQYLTASAY